MSWGWLWRKGIPLLTLRLIRLSTAQLYESDQIGVDIATINEIPFWDETYENFTTSHRQDLCGQYELFRKGEVDLRDALRGLELTAVFMQDRFFQYSEQRGIDPDHSGLIVLLMDMIAERAGFTWRNSFAVVGRPYEYNMTWTEMLWWSVNAYDISPNYWDHSLPRMDMGVAFIEPWYDGSIILVDKLSEDELFSSGRDLLNWTRPFDFSVWVLIFTTIFVSGLVYQLIEYIQGEQQDRPFSQWFMDNQYLSLLNFTQNFEYAPYTGPGRIFAFSMAFWALVISATYTANLANLFVANNRPRPLVASVEEAAAKKIPICTFKGTNGDDLLKRWYSSAERRPKETEMEMFQAMQSGECDLVALSTDGWNSFKAQKAYNPNCNLQQVGRTIDEIKSGFAMKADVGYKCTSLVRDVFDLHFQQLIDEGELRNAWAIHRSRIRDIDCNADIPEAAGYGKEHSNYHSGSGGSHKRNLRARDDNAGHRRLQLNGRQEGAEEREQVVGDETSLTLHQMAGAFVLHYGLMFVAIVASLVSPYWTKLTISWGWEQPEQVIVRSHGPTIGPLPTMDTESCRENPTTIIQAYGSPIPSKRMSRVSINTYVNPPKKHHVVVKGEVDEGDEFHDEPALEMARTTMSGREKEEERTVIDAASFARLQDHIDAKLRTTNQRFDEKFNQYEEKLNQHMAMMVVMLENMKKQEEQRYNDFRTLLTHEKRKEQEQHQEDLRPATEVPSHSTREEGNPAGKKDFGHYLRKTATEKRDFGQYLKHNSQHQFFDR